MADHTPKGNAEGQGDFTIPTISESLSSTTTSQQYNGYPPIANSSAPNALGDPTHLSTDSGNPACRKNSRLSLRGFGHFLRKNSRQEDERKFSLAQLTT